MTGAGYHLLHSKVQHSLFTNPSFFICNKKGIGALLISIGVFFVFGFLQILVLGGIGFIGNDISFETYLILLYESIILKWYYTITSAFFIVTGCYLFKQRTTKKQ